MEFHTIEPVFDSKSNILILGSFPSVKSRETEFFYGHPQNRFWKVLAAVFEEDTPQTVPEKKSFLLKNHIALWDVIASCEITNSDDSTIRNVRVNDIAQILNQAQIQEIYVAGKAAQKCYNRYLRDALGREAVCLPSTSPANACWNFNRLVKAWQCIRLDNRDTK